jgi:hypothetical protein
MAEDRAVKTVVDRKKTEIEQGDAGEKQDQVAGGKFAWSEGFYHLDKLTELP